MGKANTNSLVLNKKDKQKFGEDEKQFLILSFKCQIKDLRLIINDEKCQESFAVSANRKKSKKKNKELSNVAVAVGQLILKN